MSDLEELEALRSRLSRTILEEATDVLGRPGVPKMQPTIAEM